MLSFQGKYECAESILNMAKNNFARPYQFSEVWSLVEQCQLADRAFYHSDVEALTLACDNILALNPIEAAVRWVSLSNTPFKNVIYVYCFTVFRYYWEVFLV